MRRAWGLLTILLISAMAHANGTLDFTTAEKQWIHDHPVVRYAINSYWPIEYMSNGEHRGLTRDYIDQIAHISGLRFQLIRTRNWTETKELTANGDIDLITTVTRSLLEPDDYRGLLLSHDYFASSTAVITRSGEEVVFSPKKLYGKTIDVKGGSAVELFFRKNYPAINITSRDDPTTALEALADGDLDAVVGLSVILQPIVTRKFLGSLHWAGTLPEMPVINAMGISQSSPELVSIINKSLTRVTSDLTSSIFDRWLARTEYGAPSWGTILMYYSLELSLISLGIIIISMLAILAWRAQRSVQQSESDKSAFLAMMSHEVRSPMNGVLSSIELLQKTQLTINQQELAALANMSACNLLELLDDVLDISKLESKMMSIECTLTDFQLLSHGLADVHRLCASRRNTVLTLSLEGLDNTLLLVDPIRTRQIISNLLSNSVKFTEDGEVELKIVFQATALESGLLTIHVSDTGIGIDPTQQGRLFQAFVQADNSITRRYGGSGLGLSICKQLVDLMNGQIILESELGKGTRVSCALPVSFQHKVDDARASAPVGTESNTLAPELTQRQVLVVEDNPINQRTIGLQLAELGYRALIVDDGIQAIAVMDEQRNGIAIVLLDCHLPDMSGYEVARYIRQQEQLQALSHMPIIAISASTNDMHQLNCTDSGIDGSLSKPLSLSNLKNLFGLWLSPHEIQDQPQPPAVADSSLHSLFVTITKEDIVHLRKSLENGELRHALHYAHRLHGSALTAKRYELADLAKGLEDMLRVPEAINNNWLHELEAIEQVVNYLSDNNLPRT